MREGSTIVHISFSYLDDSNSDVMISFFSQVVRNVRVDMTLMSKLLKLNVELNFGAFGLIDDLVILKYNVLGGDHIDEDEFYNALFMIGYVADLYDDKIISTHGGVTAIDHIGNLIKEERGHIAEW